MRLLRVRAHDSASAGGPAGLLPLRRAGRCAQQLSVRDDVVRAGGRSGGSGLWTRRRVCISRRGDLRAVQDAGELCRSSLPFCLRPHRCGGMVCGFGGECGIVGADLGSHKGICFGLGLRLCVGIGRSGRGRGSRGGRGSRAGATLPPHVEGHVMAVENVSVFLRTGRGGVPLVSVHNHGGLGGLGLLGVIGGLVARRSNAHLTPSDRGIPRAGSLLVPLDPLGPLSQRQQKRIYVLHGGLRGGIGYWAPRNPSRGVCACACACTAACVAIRRAPAGRQGHGRTVASAVVVLVVGGGRAVRGRGRGSRGSRYGGLLGEHSRGDHARPWRRVGRWGLIFPHRVPLPLALFPWRVGGLLHTCHVGNVRCMCHRSRRGASCDSLQERMLQARGGGAVEAPDLPLLACH
mmetsp:Transcript_24418/g.52891  ORF Transcript_24418/g.52891 Transcript_24418/m.52891 type:complete len:405 (-) Transcript_24418:1359-2573(-)